MVRVVTTRSREVRATFTTGAVIVYQAYGHDIADASLAAGRFSGPFSRSRMTWIKPSLLWACYRSGWATKPAQERLLEVTLSRQGFDALLSTACLASFEADVHGTREGFKEQLTSSPNRVQWDPERGLRLEEMPSVRSLQLGIGSACVPDFVDTHCLQIRDLTELTHTIRDRVEAGDVEAAHRLLPQTSVYPLPAEVARRLGATSGGS